MHNHSIKAFDFIVASFLVRRQYFGDLILYRLSVIERIWFNFQLTKVACEIERLKQKSFLLRI